MLLPKDRGGERKLTAGAHSKQGQKVHPYSQHISENGQKKLSPKIGRNHRSK